MIDDAWSSLNRLQSPLPTVCGFYRRLSVAFLSNRCQTISCYGPDVLRPMHDATSERRDNTDDGSDTNYKQEGTIYQGTG
jgi:hypothetical protein